MVNIIRKNTENASVPSYLPSFAREFDEPFRALRGMLGLEPFRMLREWESGAYVPAFEIKETPDKYLFKGDVPGFSDEDVRVSVTNQRLTISGTRQEEEKSDDDTYHCYESRYGEFSRSFSLPEDADVGAVTAELKQGQIVIEVPKREGMQPKQIPLKAGGVNHSKRKD